MALSVFPMGGSGKKKSAMGGRFTDTVQTIYATFLKSSEAGFAQASGNGIQLNEAGYYVINIIAGATPSGAYDSVTYSITRPGLSTITGSASERVVSIKWEGKLPAGSVVTATAVMYGNNSRIHGVTLTAVKC